MSSYCLEQAAEPRCVRPGPITPALERFLRRPDLLERRPVVGRSLAGVEPAAVAPLEALVHLEPAVIGRPGVRPAPLVVVDAEELPQVWRVQCRRVSVGQTVGPRPRRALERGRGPRGEPAPAPRRPADSHHTLPG